MADALIGHTGFVGGNLARQHRFDDGFNSKNIESIAGREYELVVCAGAPAEKWRANQHPEADGDAIRRLARSVAGARAGTVILISTVDVYPDPVGVDEDHFIVPTDPAYGRHRLLLEKFFQDHFDTLIVRLPGLFGPGLKKNVIFDFLKDNETHKIHAESRFQFYDLGHLWPDILIARAAGLRVVNFATEPVAVREVARAGFGIDFDNRPATAPASYDFRSRHAGLFGGSRGYLYSRASVLDGIRAFVDAQRAG